MARAKRPSEYSGWFKVSSDILDDEALEILGNDGLAMWIRLLAMLNRARSADGILRLSVDGMNKVSGKRRRDVSLKSLRSLAEVGLTSTALDGDFCEITVHNWAKYNGNGSNNRRTMSDTKTKTKTKTKDQEENTKRTSPSAPLALEKTDDTWAEINAALRAYMPRSTGLALTAARSRRLKAIVKDLGADAPLAAIHGYAAMHLTKPQDSGFDPLRNFNPETCWGGKIGKYIDADTAARDSGISRPYQISNSDSEFKDSVVRMAERIRKRNPL